MMAYEWLIALVNPASFPSGAAPVGTVVVDTFYPTSAVHDGGSHPLSNYFGSLGAAQAKYPFATSLSQEVDYCACKLASNNAFGADGVENAAATNLNKRLRLPAGRYVFGNDTWTIRNLASGKIEGDGKIATVLTGNNTILAFDGLWYSELSDFSVQCQTSGAVVALDIDGNVPGHPYATRGVQGNTLRNIYVDAGSSTYGFAMCRLGGSGAQGSENLYLNVHLNSANFACYYQNGFNALNNTFVGGNFQNYAANGIYSVSGGLNVFSVGFQSTQGYKQIENSGWDIQLHGGAGSNVCIYGCRSESLAFLFDAGNVVDLRNFTHNIAVGGWFANTAYGPAAPLYKAIVEQGQLYVATTPGTTGGSKPTFHSTLDYWVGGGLPTISDGSVVWTAVAFNSIEIQQGSFARHTIGGSGAGYYYGPANTQANTITADTILDYYHDVVLCDCTSGPITVRMPVTDGYPTGTLGVDRGRQITIKKTETSANAVTIIGEGGNIDGSPTLTLAGGARHWVTLVWGDAIAGGQRNWLIISQG